MHPKPGLTLLLSALVGMAFATLVVAEDGRFSHLHAANEVTANNESIDRVRESYFSALGDGRLTVPTGGFSTDGSDKPFDDAFHKAFSMTVIDDARKAGLNGPYGNNTVSMTGSATGNHSMRILFESSGAEAATHNQLSVHRTGSDNHLTATVNGSANRIHLIQAGSNAATEITLRGNDNLMTIHQTSAAASASTKLNVRGNHATIGVTQQTPNASNTYTGTIAPGGSISITQ